MDAIYFQNALAANYPLYNYSTDGITKLLNNSSDSSALNGISNLNGYVQNDFASSLLKATYVPGFTPNPFDVTNMGSALDAIEKPQNFSETTDLNTLANNTYLQSQLVMPPILTANFNGITDLNSYVSNAYSILNNPFGTLHNLTGNYLDTQI